MTGNETYPSFSAVNILAVVNGIFRVNRLPPPPALVVGPRVKVLADLRPLAQTVLFHELFQPLVFLLRPGSLVEVRVNHIHPPLAALDISASGHRKLHLDPVSRSIQLNCLAEELVLLWGPFTPLDRRI